MKRRHGLFLLLFPIWFIGVGREFIFAKSATNLKVVVSMKPLHSLVAGVMQGVSEPVLLLDGYTSPHSYSLRPGDARALQNADVVFWGGELIESFLSKPLHSLAGKAKHIALSESQGLQLWPVREGENWESHDHDEKKGHEHEEDGYEDEHEEGYEDEHKEDENHAEHSGTDPHIWLNPLNAKQMLRNIVQTLSALDPDHAQNYRRNGETYVALLEELDQELAREMMTVKNTPYMVFHDAYQYFEKRYQLHAVGAVTLHLEYASGARRLREVRQTIQKNKLRCVFAEPQFSLKPVKVATSGTSTKIGILDPLGAALSAGSELYFTLLRNLSRSLKNCLL